MGTNEGGSLQFVSDVMRSDKEDVLAAVSQNGLALEYATDELKNDKDVVMAAVRNDGAALGFASEEMKVDKDIRALLKNPAAQEYYMELAEYEEKVYHSSGEASSLSKCTTLFSSLFGMVVAIALQ